VDSEYLLQRFENMLVRLHEAYDGIGHSSGRPYLYFVYSPEHDQLVRRLVDERMHDDGDLHYFHLDLVRLTQETLAGQEEKRSAMLNDPNKGPGVADSIMRLWARHVRRAIQEHVDAVPEVSRPVVVLRGLAALHPLGNPTMLMEAVAEVEPRHPTTNMTVPVVLLIPGTHPPQTSRTYCFLGLEALQLSFYRGEEI
jgi:hypothetical protein